MRDHSLEPLLTEDEVLRILNITSRQVLWRLRRAGQLRTVVLGHRTIRFRREDVEAFIAGSPAPQRRRGK